MDDQRDKTTAVGWATMTDATKELPMVALMACGKDYQSADWMVVARGFQMVGVLVDQTGVVSVECLVDRLGLS